MQITLHLRPIELLNLSRTKIHLNQRPNPLAKKLKSNYTIQVYRAVWKYQSRPILTLPPPLQQP